MAEPPDLAAERHAGRLPRVRSVADLARGRREQCRNDCEKRRLARAVRADDPVSSYSRGMRQRLALERALIHGPRLVLLDEPFTGLDRASAVLLTRRLRTLASQGSVVLFATHDFALADGVLDRVAVMRD